MHNLTKTIIFLILLALGAPLLAFAAEIRLDSHKAEVKTGEQFVVDVMLHSEKSLNAIEGRLAFPEDALSVREIRDGNSVINFWIEKPRVESPGILSFSGITPGGFNGPSNLVFSLVLEANKDGDAMISLARTIALLNDGAGTEEPLSIRNVEIAVKPGDSKIRKEFFTDVESPEDFKPVISKNENFFQDKHVAIFAAQDKGSGISRYEVKELRFSFLSFLSPWTRVESPYILKDQRLKSHVVIKAVDNAGNERIAVIVPSYSLSWYEYLPVAAILIIVLVLCVFIFKMIWREK